jgi:hypothetical protein
MLDEKLGMLGEKLAGSECVDETRRKNPILRERMEE